jgi:photosystem II protein
MKFILSSTLLAITLPLATAFSPTPAFFATSSRSSRSTTGTELFAVAGSIQFVKGLEETVVPGIKLTRSRDGSTGIATFNFDNPNVFDASTASKGDVTGMYMVDEEGTFSTNEVNAKFINGKPVSIESTYVMNNVEEWDRFMRFMESYSEANGLVFNNAKK